MAHLPPSPPPDARRQTGFTLVELMVALLIGLIVILGAGQLFLMGFQTFRQIELLSNKQAALTFATETLVRDIRRADALTFDSAVGELKVEFPNNGDMSSASCSDGQRVVRVYRLSSAAVSPSEGWSLDMGQQCDSDPVGSDFEPLVTSFAENGFGRDEANTDEANGVWVLTFSLISSQEGDTDDFAFHAVNRNNAIE
ncbi:PilW family protein [Billgrantia saliphila]|uniref:PilW family protein n=1 Tax=Billgrantia saliphila TaxID=1848458 RepID=UPI001E52D707|nr:prepilin-type N-terminal cleavage/methylation domain-containing protein [Halomonas saliphila]